jgi:MFS family permease
MAPNITTLSVLIFPMSEEFGWSRTLISGSVSSGAIASLIFSPVVGWAIDRVGARLVMVISVLCLGLAMISLAWATLPITFYIAYSVGRVVFHTSAPIGSSTVASRWFIKKRGRAIGVIFLVGAIGGIVFTMLASLIVENYGLKATWIIIGLLVLTVSVAPPLLFVAERPEDIDLLPDGEILSSDDSEEISELVDSATLTRGSDDESWELGEAVHTRTFWIMVIMGFTLYFVHTSIGVHMGVYFRDVGLGPTSTALAISLSWIVSAIGSVGWGVVTDRVPIRYAYSLMFLIQAVSTLYLMLVGGTLGIFLAAALFGVVSSASNVIPSVMYANYFGRSSLGRIRGVGEVGVLLGQATGPITAGILFGLQGNYDAIFTVFVLMALVCSVVALKATVPVKKPVLRASY